MSVGEPVRASIPSVAPNTTTRSHSRPFTRWIVERVTPPSARSRWNARRSHASNEPASGWRSATCSSASRSSRWEPLAPPVLSSRVMAEPRPMSSRTAVSRSRARRAALGRARRAGRGRRRGRRASAPTFGSSMRAAARRTSLTDRHRSSHFVAHCGSPRLGPAVHLAEVGAARRGRGRPRCAGRRAPPARRGGTARSRRGSSRPARRPRPARRAARAAATAPGRARRPRAASTPGSASQPCDGVDERAARRCRRRACCTASAPASVDDVGTRPDLLRHPHVVVGEQRGGRLGDRRRAAVVDLEGVLAGAREVAARSR